jgi:hypothetical protein
MKRSRWTIALLLVLLACAVGTAAEAGREAFWGLRDPAALAACRRWSTSEQRAWKAYEKEVTVANGQLRTDLEGVLKKLTDSGQLEEALKVKTAVEDLKAGKWPDDGGAGKSGEEADLLRPALARKLHGTTWKNQAGNAMTFNAQDMTVAASWHQIPGTWTVVDARTIRLSLSMNSCKSALHKLSSDGKSLINEKGETLVQTGGPRLDGGR